MPGKRQCRPPLKAFRNLLVCATQALNALPELVSAGGGPLGILFRAHPQRHLRLLVVQQGCSAIGNTQQKFLCFFAG